MTHTYQLVWEVIERNDGTTVAIFTNERLAQQYVDRRNYSLTGLGNRYMVWPKEGTPLRDVLPEEVIQPSNYLASTL